MSLPSLIQFWKLKRKCQGEACQVKPFHYDIADRISKLVMGTLGKDNLMILMPPRCAKTDLGVKATVPWVHSYFPDAETILSSYGKDLAVDNCMACRETFGAEWYRSIVDSEWGASVEMRGEKAGGRQDHFHTTEGGSVKAVGRGGGITGFGAGKLRPEFGGLIIIDDLLKANEAKSPAARKDAWSYIQGTLNSRRNRQETPKTPRLLIQQRLHPEDPAGMFLREEKDEWSVLQIPAHDDKGTVIWPGRLSMAELEVMLETDPDTYWSQYMQAPTMGARKIFKEEWWRYWRDRIAVERRLTLKIITADTAFEEKVSADWSVFQCWGFEGTSGMYLMDQDRGQWEFPDLIKHARDFVNKHTARIKNVTPATEFWIENKASGISLVQTLRREGVAARAWEPKDKTPKDKVGRAKHSTMPMAAHRVFLPNPDLRENKWVQGFINEHSAFTDDDSHLNDDQVDTHTEASSIWQERGGGVGPVPVW